MAENKNTRYTNPKYKKGQKRNPKEYGYSLYDEDDNQMTKRGDKITGRVGAISDYPAEGGLVVNPWDRSGPGQLVPPENFKGASSTDKFMPDEAVKTYIDDYLRANGIDDDWIYEYKGTMRNAKGNYNENNYWNTKMKPLITKALDKLIQAGKIPNMTPEQKNEYASSLFYYFYDDTPKFGRRDEITVSDNRLKNIIGIVSARPGM